MREPRHLVKHEAIERDETIVMRNEVNLNQGKENLKGSEMGLMENKSVPVCIRCGNDDKKKFKSIKKGSYCTACLAFGRFFVGDTLEIKEWRTASSLFGDYIIPYELTKAQLSCARSLISLIEDRHNVLVYACCGAGKTEIVFPLIAHCLKRQMKIGIAIPRRDVVVELETRIRAAFAKKDVCAVYGGHNELLDGDIVLCTTHQLFRYTQAFDVLILDEVDAFPYKGNKKLEHIAQEACKGNFVYLSATPDQAMKQQIVSGEIKQLTLFRRPHGHPLCIPEVKLGFSWMLYLHLLFFLHVCQDKTVMVFMPSIASAKRMVKWLSCIRTVCLFTSQTKDRSELLERIRNRVFQVIVCTTVLERGVTIADVQVVVWQANQSIFDEATLIQILGRVGRTSGAYEGRGLLLCQRRSSYVEACVRSLKTMNAA